MDPKNVNGYPKKLTNRVRKLMGMEPVLDPIQNSDLDPDILISILNKSFFSLSRSGFVNQDSDSNTTQICIDLVLLLEFSHPHSVISDQSKISFFRSIYHSTFNSLFRFGFGSRVQTLYFLDIGSGCYI